MKVNPEKTLTISNVLKMPNKKKVGRFKAYQRNLDKNNVDFLVSEPMDEVTLIEGFDQKQYIKHPHSQNHCKGLNKLKDI